MAAPSGTVWGSIVTGNSSGRKGRIGIYVDVSSTATQTTANVQVWFWTIYSCDDGASNAFYYNEGTGVTSASTNVKNNIYIDHNTATGTGWNTANQTQLYSVTHTISRGKSAVARKIYAMFTGIDMLYSSSKLYANTTYTVPALASYTITYNANGGSGAPSSQTKWHGIDLTLSSTKPTRTGYTFQGWALSASGDVYYQPGGTCGKNENLTIYAIWKAITYTVTYDANGGSGAPSSQTKTYGVALTLSSTKPTRINYTFKGWGTSKTATTVSYAAGASYTNNAAVTLYAIWQASYKKPRISSVSVQRCDTSGTASESGTNLRAKFSWKTDKTVSSVKVQWKLESSTSWSTYTYSATGTSGTVNVHISTATLSTESTYDIRITVADASGSTSTNRSIASVKFPIDVFKENKGIAFGKVAEVENTMDVGYKAVLRDTMTSKHSDVGLIQEHEASGLRVGFGIGGGGTNHGIYNYKLGKWIVRGNNADIFLANASAEYKPYYGPGDTIADTNVHTAGFCTSSKKNVYFTFPLSKPLLGVSSFTVTSLNGFFLRQDGNYTHGSSSSTRVFPDKYTCHMYNNNSITIIAQFTDVTNAINNATIGVQGNFTITFA